MTAANLVQHGRLLRPAGGRLSRAQPRVSSLCREDGAGQCCRGPALPSGPRPPREEGAPFMGEDTEVPRAKAASRGLLGTTHHRWAPRASPGVTSIPRSQELSP